MHASNGILFNHESPRRGETFVTRKITIGLSKVAFGIESNLKLGNLNSLRDWGHAKDYAYMQWKILQNKIPGDYVISTGKQYTVRYFVEQVLQRLGIKILWKGKGLKEVGIVKSVNNNLAPCVKINQIIIKVDKKYLRPLEVDNLIGDSLKARKDLNWKPKKDIKYLINEMFDEDYKLIKNSL